MKILLFTENLTGGGAQRVATLWADVLHQAGHTVTVLTSFSSSNEYPLPQGITRINLWDNRTDYEQTSFPFVNIRQRLAQWLHTHPQDVLIPFLQNANLVAATLPTELAPVVLPTIRNSPWDEEKGFDLVLRDWAIQKQGAVILQNTEQLEYFNTPEFAHVKKYVVHNPLNPAITEIKKDTYGKIKKIVAVGRLVSQKNHALMIEAIRILRDEFHENYYLDIYGVGELQETLQTQIDQAKLSDQVKLCGRSDDIFHVLINYDLFLMTSLYEGTPNALLEAMGLGLPSLAIKCRTGITELIDNDKNGYILDSYDAHDLAKKIRTINNHTQLERIGKQARQDMTRYATANIQAELVTMVQNAVTQPPKHVPLDPALKKLDALMTQQPTEMQAIYHNKYFKTTLYLIKNSDYDTGKRVFALAHRVLKNLPLDTEFPSRKLYTICLHHNQFDVLFTVFQTLNQ